MTVDRRSHSPTTVPRDQQQADSLSPTDTSLLKVKNALELREVIAVIKEIDSLPTTITADRISIGYANHLTKTQVTSKKVIPLTEEQAKTVLQDKLTQAYNKLGNRRTTEDLTTLLHYAQKFSHADLCQKIAVTLLQGNYTPSRKLELSDIINFLKSAGLNALEIYEAIAKLENNTDKSIVELMDHASCFTADTFTHETKQAFPLFVVAKSESIMTDLTSLGFIDGDILRLLWENDRNSKITNKIILQEAKKKQPNPQLAQILDIAVDLATRRSLNLDLNNDTSNNQAYAMRYLSTLKRIVQRQLLAPHQLKDISDMDIINSVISQHIQTMNITNAYNFLIASFTTADPGMDTDENHINIAYRIGLIIHGAGFNFEELLTTPNETKNTLAIIDALGSGIIVAFMRGCDCSDTIILKTYIYKCEMVFDFKEFCAQYKASLANQTLTTTKSVEQLTQAMKEVLVRQNIVLPTITDIVVNSDGYDKNKEIFQRVIDKIVDKIVNPGVDESKHALPADGLVESSHEPSADAMVESNIRLSISTSMEQLVDLDEVSVHTSSEDVTEPINEDMLVEHITAQIITKCHGTILNAVVKNITKAYYIMASTIELLAEEYIGKDAMQKENIPIEIIASMYKPKSALPRTKSQERLDAIDNGYETFDA